MSEHEAVAKLRELLTRLADVTASGRVPDDVLGLVVRIGFIADHALAQLQALAPAPATSTLPTEGEVQAALAYYAQTAKHGLTVIERMLRSGEIPLPTQPPDGVPQATEGSDR